MASPQLSGATSDLSSESPVRLGPRRPHGRSAAWKSPGPNRKPSRTVPPNMTNTASLVGPPAAVAQRFSQLHHQRNHANFHPAGGELDVLCDAGFVIVYVSTALARSGKIARVRAAEMAGKEHRRGPSSVKRGPRRNLIPCVGDHLGNGAKRQEQSTVDAHQTGVSYGVTALARRHIIVRNIVLVRSDIALRNSLNVKRSLFVSTLQVAEAESLTLSTCRAEFPPPGELVLVLFRVPLALHPRRISRSFPAFGPSAGEGFGRRAAVRDALFEPPVCQRLIGENALRTCRAMVSDRSGVSSGQAPW